MTTSDADPHAEPQADPHAEPQADPHAEPQADSHAEPQADHDPALEPDGEAAYGPEPTEEELQAAWEEQLKNISVIDILVQTAVSLVNLAGRRLGLGPDGDAERDLAEVRDAIDAVRALVPVLERSDIGPTMKPLRDALSSLQFEYAKLAPKSAAGGAGQVAGQAGPTSPPAGPDPVSRLWVPGR